MESTKTRAARRPPAARGTQTRNTTDLIVEAAAQLFAARGYVTSTLDDVASRAGFTKGAVYYYFKDKESLLIKILQRIEQRSIDATAARIAALPDTEASRQLESFVKSQTRWAADHPEDLAILMLMSAETAHTSPRVRAQMQSIYGKVASTLEHIIENGKRVGEFCSTQDTRDTVLHLQAVHDGNMMVWYRSGTEPKIGRRIARVTLAGFLKAVRD